MEPIYLDYNATTPCDPRVVRKMLPYFSEIYGNPANGLHALGRQAARAVETAREQVAALIEARPREILFTSGTTESNHLAIIGGAAYAPTNRRKIITCAIEHKAVLAPCKRLMEQGFELVILPVDSNGLLRLDELENALDERTFLISIQAANNEIGTLQPISQIAALAHRHGALVHCDAAQAAGKIPFNVQETEVDLASFSAHKLYGPKGIGALYMRGGVKSIPLRPLFEGGGQEDSLRAGTPNVPAIVGFGEACKIAQGAMTEESAQLSHYQKHLERGLTQLITGLHINAVSAPRLSNTTNFMLPGIEADLFLLNLPQIQMSTGSACNTGALEPSHVLQAIGLSRQQANCCIRISMGRFTTEQDLNTALQEIANCVEKLTPL